MSRTSCKKARILRIRMTEHRAATARLVQAQNEVAKISAVEGRIRNLRAAACVSAGTHDAPGMLATGEMQLRLGRASDDLSRSKTDAKAQQYEEAERRQVAHRKEESASRLLRKACIHDAVQSERRRDANAPRIRKSPTIGGAQ